MRLVLKFLVLAAAVNLSSAGFASDTDLKIEPYFQFLKNNLIGRRTVLQSNPCTGTIPGTDIRCTFSSSTFYSNILRTPFGLTYQEQISVKQTNYVPQPDGTVRTDNKDRDFVSTCEFRISRSSDAPSGMFGLCKAIYSSLSDQTGSFMLTSLRFSHDNLILKSESGNFFDAYFNNTAGYRMAVSKSESTFSLIAGKLNEERKSQIFHFDENGMRFPVGDGEVYSSREL